MTSATLRVGDRSGARARARARARAGARSPAWGAAVAIGILVLLGIGSGGAAAAPDGDKIDRTTRRALDSAYQKDLPGFDGGAGTPAPPRLPGAGGGGGGTGGGGGGELGGGGSGTGSGSAGPTAGSAGPRDGTPRSRGGRPYEGDPRRQRYEQQRRDEESGSLGGLAQVMMWGAVAIGVLLLVVFIAREMSGMTGDVEDLAAKSEGGDDDPARLLAVVERPRDDADELARQGRFADAIHTLLLRTLHELASQNLVRVTAAMTSREVLAKVPLLGDARTALAGLVTAVELTWFGDDIPSAVDYDRCRQQFELFATAYRRGAFQGARAA